MAPTIAVTPKFDAGQRDVLEAIAAGIPLATVLERIVRLVETQGDGMLCTVLLLDREHGVVRNGAAPSVPEVYSRALDGLPIGPEAGSCGAAAYRGERIIVEDIATHPYWAAYKDFALPHGLRACWSTPIVAQDGVVLGTFAMYYRVPRGPTPAEVAWVDAATHLAAMAIVHDAAVVATRQSEQRARQLARLYAVSSAVNEAIVHTRDPMALYALACRVAVEHGLARLAWIGVRDEDDAPLTVVARHGVDEGSYVDRVAEGVHRAPANDGPAGRVLRTGVPATSDDIANDATFFFRDTALAEGLRSCAAFPIREGDRTTGAFVLYSAEPHGFGPEELGVLNALGANIGFAVASIAVEAERARLTHALQQGEERLRAVIEHTPNVAIQWYDRNGRVLFANAATCEVLGWHDDCVGKTLGELNFPQAEASRFLGALQTVVATGEPAGPMEFRFERSDGTEGVLLSTIFRIPYTATEYCYVCMDVDVTAHRRMEAQIRESERLRSLVYSSVGDAIFYLGVEDDGGFRFLSVNPAFLQATGLAEEAVVGRRVDEVIPGPSAEQAIARYREAIATRAQVRWEEVSVYPAGTKYGEVTVAPVFNSEGRCTNLIGTVHDVTERRESEEQRRQLEAQLRHAQRMQSLGTFAGGIAHDFNNILTAIRGHTDLALTTPTVEDIQESLREIERASLRATALVKQILTFSRREEPQREVVRLSEVAGEALDLLRTNLPHKVRIAREFSPKAPRVLADATQIHQIVMNLGTNAGHAMQRAGGCLTVSVARVDVDPAGADAIPGLHQGTYAKLCVADTGVGMDADTRARVFEPFFSTKAQGEGTGLGLSVVHGIVENHGGVITVDSEPGRGTTFSVYLPASPRATPDVGILAIPDDIGRHILYVDDDEALVFLVTRFLQRGGYRVSGYTDPAGAVEAFRREPTVYDVVVTDSTMTGMSGATFAAAIKEIRPDMPVVMVSAYVRPEDTEAARRLGIGDVLLKPYSANAFAQMLQELARVEPVSLNGDAGNAASS